MKTLALDFVRQVIEQTLDKEHSKEPQKYFGGINEVSLISFYEQLEEEYEVNRFTEVYRDLVNQQNRSGLIMNGTIVAPETPQMMNIHSHDIRPLTFNASFRVMLRDRDMAIDTIENMMKVLKGRKRDVACFDNGKLFSVGTIANNVLGSAKVENGDFLGVVAITNLTTNVNAIFTSLTALGVTHDTFSVETTYYYIEDSASHKLYCIRYAYDEEHEVYIWKVDLEDKTIPSHTSFEKYKVSLSFDTIKIDEPKTLNSNEYCTISFGGSATVVDNTCELGNDLTKVGIKKSKIKAQTDIALSDTTHWLEPLEMPSGLGISNQISQLASHNFIQNKHNDGINPSLDYAFVLDKSETLLYQFWKYARYGIQGSPSDTYASGVTPNTIYEVQEIWSSWGSIEIITYNAKATENVEIENTESDVLTLKLTFEIQGQ